MTDLVAKVRAQQLFQPGETVVVAVSGGADSVALLDILARLEGEGLRLVVAHLNHQLRGDASDGDEEFVAGLARRYGLPFASRRVEVAALAGTARLSLEDAGRRARYQFLAETARLHGATSIALAHHLDDQAETVLIRLLRGAGGSGLSAMASESQGILKRPLLQVSRSDIERYLKDRGLSHRSDASNADTAILRNSIRHELIPLLRKYNPKISQRLAATAEILASDEELLQQVTEAAYARVLHCGTDATTGASSPASDLPPSPPAHGLEPPSPSKGPEPLSPSRGGSGPGSRSLGEGCWGWGTAQPAQAVTFAIEALALEPRGLRLRLYRRALQELRGDLNRIALSHLEAIDRLVFSDRPNARLKLPGNCFLVRSYGTLSFLAQDQVAEAAWQLEINGEGSYALPSGGAIQVRRVPRPVRLDPGSPRVAYLDPEQAPFPWLARSFAPGDRFMPLGLGGSQKVKELFINEKIPLRERRRIPLLVSGARIIWVAGVRMGEAARVTDTIPTVIRVEIL